MRTGLSGISAKPSSGQLTLVCGRPTCRANRYLGPTLPFLALDFSPDRLRDHGSLQLGQSTRCLNRAASFKAGPHNLAQHLFDPNLSGTTLSGPNLSGPIPYH
ncbi:hypothetical protein HYC85_027941 [Camellia sinensis]|uniref:Uncharacterized protein n=1 Tax=Camellia sinensis TaxID=4442 RepID=A0A7J7FTQ7_CAMSI|nr:hypothetical protein HYC85_027941 [Camellia sinensis]